MKKNIGLISAVAIALTFLLLSFTSLPSWVQADAISQNERGKFLYVTSSGSGTCTSWADACDLRSGLTAAVTTDEIWVKAGTYYPSTTGDQTAFFSLKSGVAVYGGFAGTETAREQRDWVANPTILSGDLGVVGDNSDNSYHVVYNNGITANALLDGFTITAGNAIGTSTAGYGGGMFNTASSPMLTNVTFSSNSATYGGGMRNLNSSPTLTNVTFSSNSSSFLGGGMHNSSSSPSLTNVTFSSNSVVSGDGGGMYSNTSSSPILTNVTFSGNSANYGGGMVNTTGSPTLNNVTFSSNSATYGGGMFNNSSSPTLTNVTFSSNIVTGNGGGMYTITNSSATLTNVTFSGNSGWYGGGMYTESASATLTNVTFSGNAATLSGGGMYNKSSNPTLTNAILWGNTPNQITNNSSTPVITYSDIEGGGFDGEGNINSDPVLGSLGDNGGFTLTHALLTGSLAIDAGSPTICPATDQRGFYRPTDGNSDWDARCDIGAFEAHQIIFVDKDALGLNSGTSWSHAFTSLQAALAISAEGDEVWVAAGTYYPSATGDRSASFVLKNGVAIYGGFSGAETLLDQRNLRANPTILSGDLGVVDDYTDNSHHVVYGNLIDSTAILDGFTIVYGFADEYSVVQYGGGMLNEDHSSPTLTNLLFSNNIAIYGGGVSNNNYSSPTMTHITFHANTASYGGGISNSVHSNPILTNVTFSDNRAQHSGGGMINSTLCSPMLINVTFYFNYAGENGAGIFNTTSSPILINTIVWNNTADQIYNELESAPVVTYSIIQGGGYDGEGNINLNPLLGPLADNGGFTQTHALLPGSPAIDAGSPTICPATDQRGVSRPIDGNWDGVPGCDMGAYEYVPVIFYNFLPLLLR